MRVLIIFMVAILAASALTDLEVKDKWLQFKKDHNKSYLNIVEETKRFQNFKNKLRIIEEHNAKYEKGETTWFMGINQFSDWTSAEFKHMLTLQQSKRPVEKNITYISFPEDLEAPTSIDWRSQNAVRSVKNQGNCGDCWAFSTTGSVEGQYALKKNKAVSLSEQQLLDCSGSYGNGDCDQGGGMNNAMDYIRDKGIMLESDYPYKAVKGSCHYNQNKIVGKISKQVHVQRLNENAFVQAVGTIGPLSIGINADHIDNYAGGVFDVSGCPNGDGDLNHGVLAVGYGHANNLDYWIVKNSWGAQWGEKGYIRMRRGVNLCGIAIDPLYPVL